MCGLTGLVLPPALKFSEQHLITFKTMLLMNQARGVDSTGVFSSDKTFSSPSFIKQVGPPQAMFHSDEWDGFCSKNVNPNTRILAGHTRSATVGKVTKDNSHPFKITRKDNSSLFFAHNGTLEIYQSLPGINQFDVDSEWLANKVAEAPKPEDMLGEVNGAVACWWFDTRTKRFALYHDSKRPLHFMTGKHGEFIFSSEPLPLIVVNELFEHEVARKDISELEYNLLCLINPSVEGLSFDNINVKPKTSVVIYPPPNTKPWETGSYSSGWDRIFTKKNTASLPEFTSYQRFLKPKYHGTKLSCRVKLPSSFKILSQTMMFTETQKFPYMHSYLNSANDLITLGERVPVEIYETKETSTKSITGKPLLKIQALGMNGTKLNHVFFEFWSADFSLEQLEKIDFLSGNVASIRAMTDADKVTYDVDSEVLVRLDAIKAISTELVK